MSPNLTFLSNSSYSIKAHSFLSFFFPFNSKLPLRFIRTNLHIFPELAMAVGEVMRMDIPAGGDLTVTSPELHVLAVDDSIVDRKVIERLLRISACKGIY